MTVKNIIINYLKENGYDGLCNGLCDCSFKTFSQWYDKCPLKDCEAAYRHILIQDDEDIYEGLTPEYDTKERDKIIYDKRHTYIFLTKNPLGFNKDELSETNKWFGITLDNFNERNNINRAEYMKILLCSYKFNSFLSLEPLLSFSTVQYKLKLYYEKLYEQVNWIIIGTLNVNGKPQKTVDFQKAIEDLKPYWNKIFIKDSVYKLYPNLPKLKALPYLENRY